VELPKVPLSALALEPESSRWRLQATLRLSVERTCTRATRTASKVLLIGRGTWPTGKHPRELGGSIPQSFLLATVTSPGCCPAPDRPAPTCRVSVRDWRRFADRRIAVSAAAHG